MIVRLLFITFFISLLNLPPVAAQPDSKVNRIFTLIYNQQFEEAEAALKSQNEKLDPFYALVLNIDLRWWKYSLSRSKGDAQKLKSVLDDIDKQEGAKQDKIKTLIQKSYELRYERKRYNLIKAIFIRNEINELLADLNSGKIPLSGEQLKLFNLYVSMFRYFEFINPLSVFGKSDERLKPLNEMEVFASESDWIVSTLAHYFLGRIYLKVEGNQEKGQAYFRLLAERFPHNDLFRDIANGTNKKF